MTLTAVDLFAGLGGFTEGARMAGVDVIWAANHWATAVQYHALNHPDALHACQDLHQYDFGLVPDHDIALLAPCCQGHFPNNREKASHNASRATAWAVVALLEAKRPPLAIVENITWFLRWKLFRPFCDALRALGYSLFIIQSDAADQGVPQNRVRIFILCTHGKKSLQVRLPKMPHVGVESVIRWNDYAWRPLSEKCANSQARAANGRALFGDRFVMPYYSKGSGLTGRDLTRPLGTITTKARWGIVDRDRMRMFQPAELLDVMSFPAGYRLPANIETANRLLGNAICPKQAAAVIGAVLEAA